jgi:BlaI family transcriptional regulator, penicillinase repressor
MARRRGPRPTDAELGILRVLWRRGPSTVREVHETLSAARPAGYTTVLKLLQIMTEKGLVRRVRQEHRAHVYEAALAQDETQRQIVGDLLERVFDGSATQLVMQVLSSERASAEELSRIREMLDELEAGDERGGPTTDATEGGER